MVTFDYFKFYRFVESHNRLGANMTEIDTFNVIISYLGLTELAIK